MSTRALGRAIKGLGEDMGRRAGVREQRLFTERRDEINHKRRLHLEELRSQRGIVRDSLSHERALSRDAQNNEQATARADRSHERALARDAQNSEQALARQKASQSHAYGLASHRDTLARQREADKPGTLTYGPDGKAFSVKGTKAEPVMVPGSRQQMPTGPDGNPTDLIPATPPRQLAVPSKAKAPGGGQLPKEAKLAEWMVARGMEEDLETAYKSLSKAKKNPRQWAIEQVVKTGEASPGDPNFENMVQALMSALNDQPGGGAGGPVRRYVPGQGFVEVQ